MRILIADDDAVSSARLAQILPGLGHEPAPPADGASGRASCPEKPARIVISEAWAGSS